jgi:hypothetical protein
MIKDSHMWSLTVFEWVELHELFYKHYYPREMLPCQTQDGLYYI